MRCQQRGRQGNGFIIERAQGRHDGFQPDQPADHLAGNHKYAAFITHPCPPCLRFKTSKLGTDFKWSRSMSAEKTNDKTLRPRRSALYMPGANARALEKARTLPADCLILI